MTTIEPISPHQDTLPPPRRPKYPAIAHFSILVAVLLPIGIAPIILSRRNTRALHTRLDQLTSLNSSLAHEIHTLHVKSMTRRDTIRQLNRTVEQLQAELDKLKAGDESRTLRQADAFQSFQSELRALEHRIRAQDTMLKSLGYTFADVAAFMEESKLETGETDRRVEKLREVALRAEKTLPGDN